MAQRLVPVNLSQDALVEILTEILNKVREGDSFEGSIEYMLPEAPGASPLSFDVRGSYRIGNTMGQGGMRMVGEWAEVHYPGEHK